MIAANIFESIASIFTAPFEVGLVGILLIAVGWATKKWIVPLLNTSLRKKVAEYVLVIADEVTDWLVARYPGEKGYEYLDKAVDKIMEICGVSKEVAERATDAAMRRKGIKKE
jgi:hypothetical protein